MPELPEVENVRAGLEMRLTGRTIEKVEVYWDNIIASPAIDEFCERLKGQQFERIERRGKFLLFFLTDVAILSHLRMEGKYQIVPHATPRTKHTHVIFHLDYEDDLRYLDVRKFGRLSLVEKSNIYQHPSLQKLGPEPTDEALSVYAMQQFLKSRTKSIKGVLLDQSMVAGLGNIYVDEVLFRAGIHPETPGKQVKYQQLEILREAIIKVMKEALQAGGTTIRTYANSFGDPGHYQDFLQVYGKKGKPCPNCHTPIQKIKVAGRGTHFCPHCQKLPQKAEGVTP
ncbi:bifunctional DNA-formamidopyrimidine glycosylase/DNA-(apurinic or apyrimidinic site) lyase [Allofustis seminis]|uniref:bifunctional DNA-formamidopyrimidine glycosylase/DNA-(apurinic or apyrimidinic site) lyase n=1 Tax=Allofustis seminis TaxID=166939 RepID=UPI00036D573F|nr:bifunctional DNA-formamidopyrimidine glycosylase/DNA-(apurinic or apyrimidinic site) lyase [Allofustis seminis]